MTLSFPKQWFIQTCNKLGLAYGLKTFPENEVNKGMYNMQLKKLEKQGAAVVWPKDSNDLPVLTWEQFQEQHKTSGRDLIVIGGCESPLMPRWWSKMPEYADTIPFSHP